MKSWIATIVGRPVTTTMVTVAVLLFGLVAFSRLPVELLPDLSYPTITIRTTLVDTAPTEIEELVTRPVEELVGAVPGVIRVESTSREGESEVLLDFAWGTSMDQAIADVREKLDRANLPREAERPLVLRYDPSQEPIMRLALTVDHANAVPGTVLRDHADRHVRRELEKVLGVAAVQIHGGDEEQVVVEVDPERLSAHGLTSAAIVEAIRRDNINRPGGALTEQRNRFLIRTVHEAKTPEQLGDIVVRNDGGAQLRLRDVAHVGRAAVEREELALVDGRDAVELAVHREGDANTVAAATRVLERLNNLTLAPGESVVVLSNQATFIESSVAEVRENAAVGGALAIAVLLFFLRDVRSTLVISLAIPVSLLATFVPLHALDVSLNLMSLGGLALGVGMLVDNGIVVLESIARQRELDPAASTRATAISGTARVASAVVASTLTTIAVFLPMAFIEGVAGRLVRDLSLTVSLSIASSMLVSLTLIPVLEAIDRASAQTSAQPAAPRSWLVRLLLLPLWLWIPLRFAFGVLGIVADYITRPFMWMYRRFEFAYPRALAHCVRWRIAVMLAALALCLVSVRVAQGMGRTLLPEVAQAEFFVQLELPQGTSLQRTQAVATVLTRVAAQDEAVVGTFARVGSLTQTDSAGASLMGTHLAQVSVRLDEASASDPTPIEQRILERMRESVLAPEIQLRLGHPALFSFEPPIEILVFGDDLLATAAHAKRLLPELANIEGLTDVSADDLSGRPEVRVAFDRERLTGVGLDVETAVAAVSRAIQGEAATQMHSADRQLDVVVRLPANRRSAVDDVADIQIAVIDGVPVRLGSIAHVERATGPAEIRRIDARRGIRIRARVDDRDLDSVAQDVHAVLSAHRDDDMRVDTVVAGQAEEMERSLDSILFTAGLSLFLVYVVMASTFESLLHPLLIMFTVPLALVGVVFASAWVGLPISAMVGIGSIVLAGIVVNNAIVLVDAVNQQRGAGATVDEALVAAARLRLRPIVMTTATTVLGLLPMTLGLGDGAALRQPLAVSIVGGLLVSTLLTLIVIPSAYRFLPGKVREAWRQ